MDFAYWFTPRRPVRWDIQVDAGFKENSVEYSHASGVVIRANSIGRPSCSGRPNHL